MKQELYLYCDEFYQLGSNYYANYYSKGVWRESATLSNKILTTYGVKSMSTISGEEILQQIEDARLVLESFTSKQEALAQKMFKDHFNADYSRGDIVVIGMNRKATYNQLLSILPDVFMKRIKLDVTNTVKGIHCINGSLIQSNHFPKHENLFSVW